AGAPPPTNRRGGPRQCAWPSLVLLCQFSKATLPAARRRHGDARQRPVSCRPCDSWKRRFGDCLDIEYRTVHASKGLEADYVFVLNLFEGSRGFPNQMDDNPVLQIAMPAPDPFPVAEERRLFYVALTRASRDVRIYPSLTKPSRFIAEIQHLGKLEVEAIDGEAIYPCPTCHQVEGTGRPSSRLH
ncbi:MAG: hypothetical protein E5Y86_33440, partial [Mesorhizobium sp.]